MERVLIFRYCFFILGLFLLLTGLGLFVFGRNNSDAGSTIKFLGVEFSGSSTLSLMVFGAFFMMLPFTSLVDLSRFDQIVTPSPSNQNSSAVTKTSNRLQADDSDGSLIGQEVAKSKQEIQTKKNDCPPGRISGWSYFGYRDGHDQNYSIKGANSNLPKKGDLVVARNSIPIRSGPIQLREAGWKNQPQVGAATSGECFRVLTVSEVDPGFFWIKVEPGPSPNESP